MKKKIKLATIGALTFVAVLLLVLVAGNFFIGGRKLEDLGISEKNIATASLIIEDSNLKLIEGSQEIIGNKILFITITNKDSQGYRLMIVRSLKEYSAEELKEKCRGIDDINGAYKIVDKRVILAGKSINSGHTYFPGAYKQPVSNLKPFCLIVYCLDCKGSEKAVFYFIPQ